MDLDEAMQRQAARHAVADALDGVTRLQIPDEVYGEDYWSAYRAGLASWREAAEGATRRRQLRVALRRAPAAGPQPGQPFAVQMLAGLRASGEWAPAGTVAENYQRNRLAEIEREWTADPPDGFRDGPEAG